VGGTASAVVAVLGATAWVQVGTWRNTEVLYTRALSVTEDNYLAHKAMGNELLRQERVSEAADHFAQAARLAPDWSPPRLGLADVEVKRGQIARALDLYEQVLERNPSDAGAAGRYGLALGLAGRFADARIQLARALAVYAGTAELHRAMAGIEAALGNLRAAKRHGREALRLRPGYTDAANNLAWLLATAADPSLRDAREAIALVEADAVASDAAWLLDTLAAAYAADGRFDDAIRTADRAARITTEGDRPGDARGIRQRLALYRQRRPYVAPGVEGTR
jgi:tetratricopeptide (TPR) repeat protein